jgi:hypothetical protein
MEVSFRSSLEAEVEGDGDGEVVIPGWLLLDIVRVGELTTSRLPATSRRAFRLGSELPQPLEGDPASVGAQVTAPHLLSHPLDLLLVDGVGESNDLRQHQRRPLLAVAGPRRASRRASTSRAAPISTAMAIRSRAALRRTAAGTPASPASSTRTP